MAKSAEQLAKEYSQSIDGLGCYPTINNTAYAAFLAGFRAAQRMNKQNTKKQ